MMRQLHKKPSSHTKVRGFEHLVASAFSMCLLVVLVFLPLAPLFASEDSVTDVPAQSPVESASEQVSEEDATTAETEELQQEEESEPAAVPIETQDDLSIKTIEPLPQDDVFLVEDPELVDDSNDDPSVVEEPILNEEVVSDEENEDLSLLPDVEVSQDENTSTSTEATASSSDDSSEELDTASEEIADTVPEELAENDSVDVDEEVVVESEMATVTPEAGELVLANVVTTDENRFSFAKGECASVGGEMFYCAKADISTTSVTHTDRVFAASDAEGDKEIYIEKNGEVVAITDNAIDDDAPYYDPLSDTIVWHRLIEGRYQIVSYDIDSEEESQLTNDRYNNMAPSRYDELTVWQGWVGNDWEIFILEGNDLVMITDNTTHDIAPSVNGTHIIWQSFETGVWQMKVYDTRTKQISTIEDTDGGSVQNPRFVLVYDTKYESGDIETRGYDLISGEVVPLSAIPASIPSEIPDPDQTGEERALVSPQTQPKTKVDEGDEDLNGAGGDIPEDDILDIVIPALSGTTTDAVESTSTSPTQDVLVTPMIITEVASTTDHIDDVIVTPFVEPISIPEDAQQVIVSES